MQSDVYGEGSSSKVLSSQKTVVYKTEYGLERAWGVT